MSPTSKIIGEKNRVQKQLAEEAPSIREYLTKCHEDAEHVEREYNVTFHYETLQTSLAPENANTLRSTRDRRAMRIQEDDVTFSTGEKDEDRTNQKPI